MENRDSHELEETIHCLREEVARQKENAAVYQRAHRRLAMELERVDAQLLEAREQAAQAQEARARALDAEVRAQRREDQLRTLGVEKLNIDLQLQQALDRAAARRGARRGDGKARERLECRSGSREGGVDVHPAAGL